MSLTTSDIWDPWLDAFGEVREQRDNLASVITTLLFAIDNADYGEGDPKKQLEYIRSLRNGKDINNCLVGIEAQPSSEERVG